MLFSHLFFCLPLLLAHFNVPCRIVFSWSQNLRLGVLIIGWPTNNKNINVRYKYGNKMRVLRFTSRTSPLHARGEWDVAIPSEFAFIHHGYDIIMYSNCILDSVANLLVCHMVFVGNVQKSPIASHLKVLDPSLEFCCQGTARTDIKEGG